MHTKFYLENLKERDHWHRWQDTIEVGHKEIWCENVDLFSLALVKDQCWAVVNMLHKMLGNVFTICLPAAIFKKNSFPMELVIMSEPVKSKLQLHVSVLVFAHKGQL